MRNATTIFHRLVACQLTVTPLDYLAQTILKTVFGGGILI
jgi:hypothetical protein